MPRRKTSDSHFADLTKEIDIERFRKSIQADFLDFPDPQRSGSIVYPAWCLLFVILSGYLAGGNTVDDIAHFAELKEGWLKDLLDLESVPSYDTIWWFMVRTDPRAFKELISRWLGNLPNDMRDQLLVIDGKRLRGTSDSEHITHVVEMFAAETRLTIAQEKVPEKSSEPVALPALLDTVKMDGAIVSMDALYAHVSSTQQVLDKGADYIVGIKGNQPNLKAEVVNYFEQARADGYKGVDVSINTTEEKGHGRFERRVVIATQELDWLPQADTWGIHTLVEVCSERHVKGSVEKAIRYYASSREAEAGKFAQWIRDHWSIENNLHHVLDVIFREDASLTDSGNSAENTALLRRLAMNIIALIDPNRGMANARRSAMHDPRYLRGLLARVFC